jgi:hypothetical protein
MAVGKSSSCTAGSSLVSVYGGSKMWRICDLYEAAPLNRCESLNSASVDFIRAAMLAVLPATCRDRALICKIDTCGKVVIQVAFERESIGEPPYKIGRKMATTILRSVSAGAMDVINGDLTVRASRWIGVPGSMQKVSERPRILVRVLGRSDEMKLEIY